MLFATIGQGRLFLWMMASGVAIGLWYGMTAGLRRVIQAKFWLTLCCDLLFGLGAAVILCGALVAGNWGSPRPFALLAAGLGALVAVFGLVQPLGSLFARIGTALQRAGKRLCEKRLMKFLLK